MLKELTMPQLGESVTEGTISKWLVKPGDHVNKYDPIAEVMTDKVNAEIPSSFTGTIKELTVREDEAVEVGKVICTVEIEESISDTIVDNETVTPQHGGVTIEDTDNVSQKKRYSPAVLRLSQEHNINLDNVLGTGKGGRITRKDIMAIVEGQQRTPGQVVQEESTNRQQEFTAVPPVGVPNQASGDIEIPLTGVRKAIAANMVKSKHEAPHAWMMVEVDATNLVNFRNKHKASFKEREGFNLTYLPFFIKAVVEAIKEFPQVNSMWAGDKIIQKNDINISLAVASEDALFVPVIKHADEKSIKGLAFEIQELATKVRTGRMSYDDMQDGTFTVNNTGSFGSILSNPIIKQPQAANLSVESIVKRPVIVDDMIAIRSMVNLCLSLDHRILDGLVCGRFLARVKEKIESISIEHTSIY
ncbi:dihydrolipoamide acetyltransferase family protein [Bacillus alkalicellulosilyticus]|uniref:dihydrolipoamide acetyltransferase family protein n=1 Tax=Alkalihalobacterium alkalicellulosilyticum TaxID=1912214 RepID=UPI0009979998|nr:dihydrolipoamide acetyltransferase family protein [Bacillus alkalicellulosilyticus]